MSGEYQFDYQQLDELLHSRIRTAIVAILDTVEKAEFSYLKNQTGATDGNLSTHLRKLEEAEYIGMEKKFLDRKPVTIYWLTDKGKDAFREYINILENMLKKTEK
jgi:DNA-binding MarR family transcriptional regulator